MDGAPPPEENFEAQPIQDRLLWKARVSAYTALITTFKQTVSDTDPAFRPYVSDPASVKEWVRDNNAMAQEMGVAAACSLLEWAGKNAARTRAEVLPSLVEKCLGAARAGTKTKAIELCLLYVAAEEDQAEGVLSDLTPGLDVKQPKVVAGCVTVLKEIVRCATHIEHNTSTSRDTDLLACAHRGFGPKTINIKPILKLLPKIFAHADKAVRLEGTALVMALHAYLGPALDPHLSSLKPVQVKELNEAFADADAKGEEGFGQLKPSRFTLTQQREREVKQAEGALEGTNPEEAEEEKNAAEGGAEDGPPDAFDFAEPVDVLNKLSPDFYTHVGSTKWKDRKELALEPLLAVVKVPRIKNDNYDELLRSLGGMIPSYSNVLCIMLAANCIEAMALGLRDDFAKYRSLVIAPILSRTKEKKANVLEAFAGALDATFASVRSFILSMNEIVEDIVTFAKDKNPSVKEQTIKWCTRCLKVVPSPPQRSDIDQLIAVLSLALADSAEPVRIAAAEALGYLMKVCGERAMGGKIEELDDLRKAKVKEAYEKAETKCTNGGGRGGAVRTAPAAGGSSMPAANKSKPKPMVANKENAPLAARPTASAPAPSAALKIAADPAARPPIVAKKLPVASTSSAPIAAKKPVVAAVSASSSKSAGAAKPAEPLKYKMSQEDAEAQVEAGAIPANLVAQISDANWKTRLEGITALHDWLSGGEIETVESELVVRYLGKKPGWKESNFQVSTKMFGILHLLAERSPSFGKSSAALSVPGLSDKLGDIKLKKPAGDALTAFAEKSSLGFVLSLAYEPMTKQKAPKAQADSLLWVEQALRDFGIIGVSIRDLIEFLKTGLKSSNASVRTNATKTLVTLKLYVGADIATFLQDLNPQLITTIESEFAKVAGEAPPEPTRVGADTAVAASAAAAGPGAKGKGAISGSDDPLDDLFPRVELDRLIPSSAISGLGDSLWKTRKEALEMIQSILEGNKRLKPSPLNDLSTPLKQRLVDANKIVQVLALDVIARIATGMGKPFERHCRLFVAAIVGVLGDQKAPIRAAATACLTAIADAAGLDAMITSFDKALETGSPVLRKDLLAWLEPRFQDEDVVATLELRDLAGPVIACLEDKTAEVRRSAQALLPGIISRVGYQTVLDRTGKLKPASKATVLPLLEAARGQANLVPSSKAPTVASFAATPQANIISQPTSRPASAASGPIAATSKLAPGGLTRPTAVNKSLRAGASISTQSASDDAPASRLGAPRPRVSLGSKPLGASRSSPNPASSGFASVSEGKEAPFRDADPRPKTLRASKETGSLKWVVDGTPRADQVETLLQQMTPYTSPDLLAQLFSKDHNAERDYIAALTALDDCARDPASAADAFGLLPKEFRARLVVNVDVIFKYITLRIGMTSTTITVKCLDLIDDLLVVLGEEGHNLSDYEAWALLISLIAKVGDGKETIRGRVRAIFKALCSVYPYSKVFAALVEYGLVSKNARVRAETAEELGSLFQRHGASALPTGKALPLIAKLISDRDAAVRTAALYAIGHVYSSLGADATWKLVGRIPDKERAMLEERLKRTVTTGDTGASAAAVYASPKVTRSMTPVQRANTPSRVPGPGPASPTPNNAARGIAKPGISRLARPSGLAAPTASSSALGGGDGTRRASGAGLPAPGFVRPPSATATATSRLPPPALPYASSAMGPSSSNGSRGQGAERPPSPIDIALLIDAIETEDLAKCANVLKRVQTEIATNYDALLPQADALIDAITLQMALGFEDLHKDSSHAKLRLCKHLMQTLSSFFDHRTLGQAISTPALTSLLAELTGRLLDTADSSGSDAIASLSKVLNMVLIRIFHHSDQTVCVSSLFTVLQDATIDLRELKGSELEARAKYAELVMKCLWKVSKTVKESLESRALSAPRLLRDINQFLTTTPPAEWRRRAADNIPLADMPLRTVKTILQQVVSVFGEAVFDELEEIDSAEDSFVYQYLFRLASSPSSKRNGSAARSQSGDRASASSMNRQSSTGSFSSVHRESLPARQTAATPSIESEPPSTPKIGTRTAGASLGARASISAANSPGGADIEMNQQLKAIFDLIGDPVRSREGIEALYIFQKTRPEAAPRIASWMANTGNYFQTYLKRALRNLEMADQEHEYQRNSPAVESGVSAATGESKRKPITSAPRLSRVQTITSFIASSASSARPVSASVTASSRPTSTSTTLSPRHSRASLGASGGATGGANCERLSQLQEMFGFNSAAAGGGGKEP
ncbi:BQ5605_C022g09426 [Microbotryum silenes-dioicae]|uniref:BQ5605_C022g09426 protein n=1 Tax=Microbotryum silenes-dioicae TaxID=796604 RepID=A0A2X0PL49_9BASI|nr:BQ5605_C022g09426 [Microbotryum silenes-dioicae]